MNAQYLVHNEGRVQKVIPTRPESPTLECHARKAIELACQTLIEGKSLYQKVTVDLAPVDAALKPFGEQFIREYESSKNKDGPRLGGAIIAKGDFSKEASIKWTHRSKALLDEVKKRPWIPLTHQVDHPRTSLAGSLSQSAETIPHQVNLIWFFPSVNLLCSRCKDPQTFAALTESSHNGYPSSIDPDQVFFPLYRCERCKDTMYWMFIRRTGLQLHFCGCAPRKTLPAPIKLREELAPILNDATSSAAEGDVFAACYHLRTLIEHYIKLQLNIDLPTKMLGYRHQTSSI